MPELPDLTAYLESLERRIATGGCSRVKLFNPFLLRTAVPPIGAVEGKTVAGLTRIGKRIVFALEDELFLVLHLMIAGRLHWPGKKTRSTLALFEFENGTLSLTEAGSKRRASLHLVQGEAALRAMDPGGIEVLEVGSGGSSRRRLKSENHTLKRALTDPRLFAGIGNAYSDEILHHAKLSPIALTKDLVGRGRGAAVPFDPHRAERMDRAAAQRGRSRRRSPPSARRWRCTAATASRARCAARRCSASCTPRTRPTTARAARPAAGSSPTARSRACSRRAGRARSMNCLENSGSGSQLVYAYAETSCDPDPEFLFP